jgi:hypothetical protein
MANEQVFADGIRCFNKRENAPDFVVGSMCITLSELLKFCKEHHEYMKEYNGEPQLILKLQISKQKNLIAVVDTYKKDAAPKDDLPF